MGKKNKQSNEGEQKEEEENKKKENVAVVLKADLHCGGCASKLIKSILSLDGVGAATIGDDQKITVVGKMDLVKLREKVEQKTHKKVELISPQPKKDGGDNSKGKGNGGENGKTENKKESKDSNKSNDKSDQKKRKEKELPVTTAVFKVNLNCEGCIQKICKAVTKTKGYEGMEIDEQKDLLTVTGAIDMKALAEVLSKQLNKSFEIVPPKDGEKKEKGGADGRDTGKNGGGGGDKGKNGDGGEGNKMQELLGRYPYPFLPGPVVIGDQFHYNPYPVYPYHAPQLFSDENPNACSVM